MDGIDGQAISISSEDGQADRALAGHIAEIRRLGKRVVQDIIEIGRRLTECQKAVGHGGWAKWLEAHFGWSDRTALNFMRAFEMSKSEKFSDLDLPVSALYLLAAPSTPEEARDEIIERAKVGEQVPLAAVKETIARAKARGKSNRTPRTLNPKPLPDVVDGCIAVVRRRIEDTVLELSRRRAKRRSQLGRLFAGLTDVIEDLEHKVLAADEEAAAEAEKREALYQPAEKGSEPIAALVKVVT
jgi:hypothetical protein